MRANGTSTALRSGSGDEIGQDDNDCRYQQRHRDIKDPFDLSRTIDFSADGAPQQPRDHKGLGADRYGCNGKEMNGAAGDPEKNRRDSQQQRLRDEQLQRRQDLAGGDDAERRQQKERASQCVKRGNDRKGRARHHGPRFPISRVIIATTEVTNAAPRNSVIRKRRNFASDDSI